MDKRHFTVVIGSKEHGLYVSSTPSSAAKKAVSKLCASNKSKKVEFCLREITQGSKKKTYGPYLGEMKKLKTPIELKGRIIRYETIVKLKKVKNNMKGGLFKCADDTRKIKELCVDDESGKYEHKDECETYCLDQKLNTELTAWKSLFKWCLENLPNNPIYCKGGSALGLEVLKSILNKDPSKYQDFLSLNLIKDWDFTVFMSEEDRERFIKHVTHKDLPDNLRFNVDGKKITMIRFNNALMIGDDYLLELSAKIDQTLDDLELPLTNLKFEVNSNNIGLFFEIVKIYVKNDIKLEKMLEILNELLNKILVNGVELVDSIENGLYTITDPRKISTAGLSDELLGIMDKSVGISNRAPNGYSNNRGSNNSAPIGYSNNRGSNNRSLNNIGLNGYSNNRVSTNIGPNRYSNNRGSANSVPIKMESINPLTMKQFLITQFSQPDRLFLRFFNKNVKKSIKIREFYENNGIPLPPWLIDERILEEILLKIDRFLDEFNKYIESQIEITEEFLNNPKPFFKKFIDKMDYLFKKINLSNLRLNNPLIDLRLVAKLIPMNIFEKLKEKSFEKREASNLAFLDKIVNKSRRNLVEASKKKKRNTDAKNFNYTIFLPTGEKSTGKSNQNNVNHVYDHFLRTFLSKIQAPSPANA